MAVEERGRMNQQIQFPSCKTWDTHKDNKGIGDAGSTADFRMLWSALVCYRLQEGPIDFVLHALRALRPIRLPAPPCIPFFFVYLFFVLIVCLVG